MAMKTTSTTNNAGVPPVPPEAHLRAGEENRSLEEAARYLLAYVAKHAQPASVFINKGKE